MEIEMEVEMEVEMERHMSVRGQCAYQSYAAWAYRNVFRSVIYEPVVLSICKR